MAVVYNLAPLLLLLPYVVALIIFAFYFIKRKPLDIEYRVFIKRTKTYNRFLALSMIVLTFPVFIMGNWDKDYFFFFIVTVCALATFYSMDHFTLRICQIGISAFLLFVFYSYYREIVLQIHCMTEGLCSGKNQLGQLDPFTGIIGTIDSDPKNPALKISLGLYYMLFGTILASTFVHYLSLLLAILLCAKLGVFSDLFFPLQIENLKGRPEDVLNIHDSIATKYYARVLKEKKKGEKRGCFKVFRCRKQKKGSHMRVPTDEDDADDE